MFKKTIGYGILVCVLFLAALIFIPSTISPTASITVQSNQFSVQQVLSDLEKFRQWDPKAITDTTVSYDFTIEDGKPSLAVTDSLNRIMATYVVEKSSVELVEISVNIKKVEPLLYVFQLSPSGNGTKVEWSMDFNGNLMMSMFGAEDQLAESFKKGMEKLAVILEQKTAD